MADLNAKLIPLYSEVEGRVPTAEQLDVAELSYNITDRKIYTKDSDGNIVIMGAGADDTGGSVDSVNGQTGEVILNVVDLNDVEQRRAEATGWTGRWIANSSTGVCQSDGDIGRGNDHGPGANINQIDSNGTDLFSEISALANKTLYFSVNEGAWQEAAVNSVTTACTPTATMLVGCPDLNAAIESAAVGDTIDLTDIAPGAYMPLTEGDVLQFDGVEEKWFSQPLVFNLEAASDFALRTDQGSGNPIPKETGDSLVWDGAKWVPANPAGFLSISDLNDVNTVTNAPTDGQALVWDETQGYWRPGTVASEAPSLALNDLTDVSSSDPSTGEFLKYDSGSWGNAALVYADISDAPTVPTKIGDLSDVDLSDAPVVGQVLVWNGTDWKPDDQSGGGGGTQTVTGALSERADVTDSRSYNVGASRNIEFEGLGEAGSFVQVTSSQPAWIRFYATDGDRTGDASRQVGTDPQPGSGVLLEVRTDEANQTIKISPGALYYNNDILPAQTLYARVTNESGASAVISVTIRAYTQTSTDTIDGGTFGSG